MKIRYDPDADAVYIQLAQEIGAAGVAKTYSVTLEKLEE